KSLRVCATLRTPPTSLSISASSAPLNTSCQRSPSIVTRRTYSVARAGAGADARNARRRAPITCRSLLRRRSGRRARRLLDLRQARHRGRERRRGLVDRRDQVVEPVADRLRALVELVDDRAQHLDAVLAQVVREVDPHVLERPQQRLVLGLDVRALARELFVL